MNRDQDFILRAAISQLRLVRFTSKGRERVAEPHDYGVIGGIEKLFYYQVGGASRSSPPVGWRWADGDEMSGLEMLDRTFAGPRPTKTGQHVKWDRIIASVSQRATNS